MRCTKAQRNATSLVYTVVVLRTEHEPNPQMTSALQTFIKGVIAPYKYPRAIEYARELPRTSTGKLQRFNPRQER